MQIQHATHSTPALPAHGLFSHPDVVHAKTTTTTSRDEDGRSYTGLFREPIDPAPHPGAAG
ncbi:hypothetical protein [Lentzea albida]|uniref:Uncharacterized protein n=1 Tax=Lentzea albida TaxID=65499 RepID=A0A1H9MKE0_9PSEU|nr:hypothetical protein [Lentzea albida]SER24156.1 hypothetical protein SAMN04488000_10784 [Lentzea albida]